MNNSPEIENIIEQSIAIAKEHKHQYVTVEHLLLSLVSYQPFKKCLNSFGCEVDLMISEIQAYIVSLKAIENKEETAPKKTNSLERVMNRSALAETLQGWRVFY
jgi:ATP-dependent Clp protease ATP-binding subunit ClpA